MKPRIGRIVIGVVMLLCAILLMVTTTLAENEPVTQAPAGEASAITVVADAAEQALTERFWNDRTMRQARPLRPARMTAEEMEAAETALGDLLLDEGSGSIPGRPPAAAGQAAGVAAQLFAPADGPGSAFLGFVANKFDAYWKVYPYNTVGRVFFKTPQGKRYCTAAVVGPHTILTAAQCVYNTKTDSYYSNWSFCPAYRAGVCPYGSYPWKETFILPDYVANDNPILAPFTDVALIELKPRPRFGLGVHEYVGSLGLTWGNPPEQQVTSIGYPKRIEGGKYSYICQTVAGKPTYMNNIGLVEMGCDSNSGHFGGPWLLKNTVLVNNVMNFDISGSKMGGLRFTTGNIVELCDMAAGC